MIAKIIVNYGASKLDKFFDYLIPEEMTDTIRVGSRVIVPFGASNKQTEGYVFEVNSSSRAKRLKSVLKYVDDVFDAQTAELISWMRDKYLCSYSEIIKTVIPSGISVKPEEWIVLNDKSVKNEITDTVESFGGAIEINHLLNCFEKNVISEVKELLKNGVLIKEMRHSQRIKVKKIRVASSLVSDEEFGDVIRTLKASNAVIQEKMLEILSANDRISLSDLVCFSGGSYNAIQGLEKKGFIRIYDIEVDRLYMPDDIDRDTPPKLNDEQEYAKKILSESIKRESFDSYLLHGVTGSGKTEVYMSAIQEAVDNNKKAIMLVPEIALTPQMVKRFYKRFGSRLAVFHSGLSLGERYDEWRKMREGKVDIAIGARSAIFAPFNNIGVIIIDEEHESTYKSDMSPRYNAKEVAEFRAMQNNAVLVMGSATPDISDYYRTEKSKIIELKKRANNKTLPHVEVVDMRKELEEGNRSLFSRKLVEELKKNLERKEQSIFFLNRRGYSTFVSCRNCGFVAKCPNCSISLTYHKNNDMLKCHYCGYVRKNFEICPSCKSKYIKFFGGGTQRVEEEIKKLFPEASTIRMDVDTTTKQNSHEEILSEFEKKKIDVLVGTQMVTKGLDFANVTLVGIISADVILNIQDYRSSERAFDLIEQVTGRAGRAEKCGRSVIQTYTPEHYAVSMAQVHNYMDFYKCEIETRRAMYCPPFCEIVSVLFSGEIELYTELCAKKFAKDISFVKEDFDDIVILGPNQASVAKINNKFRWRIIIKCPKADDLKVFLVNAREKCKKDKNFKEVNIIIDVNPNNVF